MLPLTAAAIPSDGMFAFDSSKLNRYGKRYVRTLSGQLAGANRIRCTGHTDSVGPPPTTSGSARHAPRRSARGALRRRQGAPHGPVGR